MDKLVATLAGMGIPGIVFLFAVSTAGVAGGAAITVALAALGGPLGMLGGVGLLVTAGLITKTIAEYGIEAIVVSLVKEYEKQGTPKEKILRTIDGYPITKGLKRAIREHVQAAS